MYYYLSQSNFIFSATKLISIQFEAIMKYYDMLAYLMEWCMHTYALTEYFAMHRLQWMWMGNRCCKRNCGWKKGTHNTYTHKHKESKKIKLKRAPINCVVYFDLSE